ncbi:unnamed protein product [Pipistrellus nathusii]|uniref:Uncharacterized protein n=1 Tax=Pipistrellus nathusii TaxID=59473 RepID=A0ABP0A5K3_PIPNA
MRTLMQLRQGGRGPGEPGAGARLRLQLVSLAPSEPVSAGPPHLGRGAGAWGRPGPAHGVLDGMPSQGSEGAQGTDETRMPTCLQAPRPGREGQGPRYSPCVPSEAGAATPPGPNLSRPAGTHRRRQALPHSRTAVAGFAPGQGGAGQSPFCFLFLPMPLLEASRGLPGGDMKEEETR